MEKSNFVQSDRYYHWDRKVFHEILKHSASETMNSMGAGEGTTYSPFFQQQQAG